MDALRSWNVFGTATITQGKVIVLAVAVRPNHKSIEQTVKRESPLLQSTGVTQVLFGANIQPGSQPEIAVYQIGSGDIYKHSDVRSAINNAITLIVEIVNKPQQPNG